jgi:hypothetical protein
LVRARGTTTCRPISVAHRAPGSDEIAIGPAPVRVRVRQLPTRFGHGPDRSFVLPDTDPGP